MATFSSRTVERTFLLFFSFLPVSNFFFFSPFPSSTSQISCTNIVVKTGSLKHSVARDAISREKLFRIAAINETRLEPRGKSAWLPIKIKASGEFPTADSSGSFFIISKLEIDVVFDDFTGAETRTMQLKRPRLARIEKSVAVDTRVTGQTRKKVSHRGIDFGCVHEFRSGTFPLVLVSIHA